MSHRYAAILAADVAHFSSLMEEDGEATVRALQDCRGLFQQCVESHSGREFGSVGDSLMAEFPSPVEALRAARDIQTALESRNAEKDEKDRLRVRIGLHAGDVIREDESLFGDVVNIAARLQEVAKPGDIAMSSLVHDQVHKEPGFEFRPLGQQRLKNIAEPVRVYEVARKHRAINWRRLWLGLVPYKTTLAAILGVAAACVLIVAYFESRLPGIGSTIEIPGAPTAPEATHTDVSSIAVLPFADLSPLGDQEYFSDGISEELLSVLSRIPGLRVAARTSSFQFKGDDRNVIDIGRQLNVSHILEGSVRKSGNDLRITVQLVKADDGFQLWSSSYDRELDDVFDIQREIATAVVDTLGDHLHLPVGEVPGSLAPTNAEAHNAYLRGRHLIAQRTESSIEAAIREFERSIAIDPGYAPAHAQIALGSIYLKRDWDGSLPISEAIARASPHVEQAMALDPNLAETHYAAGHLAWNQRDLKKALLHFRRAVEINPNYSIAQNSLGSFQAFVYGRYDEAFAAWETAARLDPLSIPSHQNYVISLVLTDRLEAARTEIEKFAEIHPDLTAFDRAFVSSLGGYWSTACLGILDALRINSEPYGDWVWLSMCLAMLDLQHDAASIATETRWPLTLKMLGKTSDAVDMAAMLYAEDPDSNAALRNLAVALASAGNYARAGPMLEKMWQQSGRRVTVEGLFREDAAAALVAVRRDAGDDAADVVSAIADDARRRRDAGVTRGRIFSHVDFVDGLAAYFAGERERGLALMAKGAKDGYFIKPCESYLQLLYDDPGFAVILEDQKARQARERGKFLAIVCDDSPYAEIWQPAEGTCERFAAVDWG